MYLTLYIIPLQLSKTFDYKSWLSCNVNIAISFVLCSNPSPENTTILNFA